MLPLALLGLILARLLVVAAPAEDVGLPVALSWRAPPECATQAEIEQDIARLSGARPLAGPDAQRVDVEIRAGYAMELRRTLADGTLAETRVLEGPDCRVLGRAAALIVVVAIDPLEAAAHVDLPELELAPTVEVVDAPPRTVTTAAIDPIAPPRPRWRHRFLAGALGGLAIGTVPGPSGSVGGWLGYAYGPLRFELAGDHVFARTSKLDDGVAIVASSTGGGFTFVFAPQLGPVLGLFGTGAQLGVQRGQGRGDRVQGKTVTDLWAAIPIVIGLEWPPRSRIALRVQGELAVAVRRPGLALIGAGRDADAFRRPLASARVLVGPTLRLP
jgi:hypothetical protein